MSTQPLPFYALLGTHPELSSLELAAILPAQPILVSEKLAELPNLGLDTPQSLQNKLGGTLKILEQVTTIPTSELDISDDQALVRATADALASVCTESNDIIFSVTALFHEQSINNTHVKKQLQKDDYKVRFREGKRPYGVPAAVLIDGPITELFIFEHNNTIIFAKSVTWQDINEWTYHDRSRPFADRKRGMLPLKVARMLLNIATEGKYDQHHVYDPFCGAGSILQEALQLGIACTGSDVSHEAIRGTQKNMEWYLDEVLANAEQPRHLPHLFVADATQTRPKHLATQPTAIVTEPFLGKQTASFSDLPNIYKGLYKLYKGAFNAWIDILPSQAKIVIIFPAVQTGRVEYTLAKLIDELPDLGYNVNLGPVVYARPDAHTRRHVYVITKK
jgi:tRNA G10  N-methylase Trm11